MYMKEIELEKWGDSQGIKISKDELEELGCLDKTVLFKMGIDNGQIILTPKRKFPETIEELFADYEGEHLNVDDKFDWEESYSNWDQKK